MYKTQRRNQSRFRKSKFKKHKITLIRIDKHTRDSLRNKMYEVKELRFNKDVINECDKYNYINLNELKQKLQKYDTGADNNNQFRNIVKAGLSVDMGYIQRLIALCMKKLSPKLYGSVNSLLMGQHSDKYVYDKLIELHHIKMPYAPRTLTCNKEETLADKMVFYLTNVLTEYERDNPNFFHKYLDVGCGRCTFTKLFANALKIKEGNIYGMDADNFAEQGDWARDTSGMIFHVVPVNTRFPYPDNYFSVISTIMVVHHVDDLKFFLEEVKRVLKPDGYFIVVDHDVFTPIDRMMCDIEHLMYTEVTNRKKDDKRSYGEKLGFTKYRNWMEFTYDFNKHGFKLVKGNMYSGGVKFDLNPTRKFWAIYKLKDGTSNFISRKLDKRV